MTIDLSFRPVSYSDFDDPVALAMNGINDQMRREMVRDMLSAEGEQREHYDALLGPIQDDILEERADESFIHNLSDFWGPSWMGGEYLPPLKPGEVEIARVGSRPQPWTSSRCGPAGAKGATGTASWTSTRAPSCSAGRRRCTRSR